LRRRPDRVIIQTVNYIRPLVSLRYEQESSQVNLFREQGHRLEALQDVTDEVHLGAPRLKSFLVGWASRRVKAEEYKLGWSRGI
jgi:hypothetical protein